MWEAIWRWIRQWFASEPEAAGGYTPPEQVASQRLHRGAVQGIENGADNVQVGVARGDVSVSNQAVYNIYHLGGQRGPQEVSQASRPPCTPQSVKADVTMPSSVEQSAALRRLDKVPNRVAILDFMEREFGTRMVIHLKSEQLYRLNRYLDVVLHSTKAPPRKRSPQTRKKTH